MMLSSRISEISLAVSKRMCESRFKHTLGVCRMAERLAEFCLPEKKEELYLAGLLHDVSKELSVQEQIALIKSSGEGYTDSDLVCEAAHHSITAAIVISRDFPDVASEELLSAVRNHTLGAPNMSLFDEIIFVSDYIEDGRTYSDCIRAREKLFSELNDARDREECIQLLHVATREILDYTITYIIAKGAFLHERTVQSRNAFLSREPMPLL